MEKVEKELQKCNCRAERVQANVSREQVERIMEQVRERLIAVEEIANMTNSTQLMEQVREMFQLMEKVNQSLQAGNVTEAYVLALRLQVRSEFALKNAYMEFKMAVKSREELKLRIELEKLEAQVAVLEKAGIDVSTVKTILDRVEEAIEAGNYSVAKVLLKEAKKALHELYREKKSVISMPGTGGHDEKSGKH